tara:strand:+ start:39 stop:302 length:264 start_codon:yes stop_codon:yes gene_type:complete
MRPQLQRQAVYRGNFKFHRITVPMRELNGTWQTPFGLACAANALPAIRPTQSSRLEVVGDERLELPTKGGLRSKRPARHQARAIIKT